MPVLDTDKRQNRDTFAALAEGRSNDPFAVLGVHSIGDTRVVRTLQPHAKRVDLVDVHGEHLANMCRVLADGLFAAVMPPRIRHYLLRITTYEDHTYDIEDPYRFPQTLGDLDLYLLGEGSDSKIYDKLGAQLRTIMGIDGARFSVWAPNASRVSVVGDFNDWDGRRHSMRVHPANGIWEIFLPGVAQGDRYKYEMLDKNGTLLPLKTDPYGSYHEAPPGNASIVYASHYDWQDQDWTGKRSIVPDLDKPVSIYEVHLGSWRRNATRAAAI